MNKVNFPALHCDDVYATCLLSVGPRSLDYKIKLNRISEVVATSWQQFDDRCTPKNLHLFPPCHPRNKEQVITGNVTKDDLMNLYTRHMLKLGSESRKIYDKLRAASNGVCPLCGIHGVATLDHYLPKARYPLFSVNPKNLIPACQNCNDGKSDSVFVNASDLTLYPYNDDNKFYKTDWISATIATSNGILVFDFFPDPPKKWLNVERQRVINHFKNFSLRSKYSINAAQFVTTINSDIRRMLLNGDHNVVQSHYQELAGKVPFNSTLRVMYNAIAKDLNICRGDY